MPSLPPEVLGEIVSHVESLSTASSLLRVAHEVYTIALPQLYTHLTFPNDDSLACFLRCHEWSPDLDNDLPHNGVKANRLRKCLETVQTIHLDAPPRSSTAGLILALADRMPLHHVFPRCHTLTVSRRVLDNLPSRAVSTSYNTSKATIKIYEGIRRLARPKVLRVASNGHDLSEAEAVHNSWVEHYDRTMFFLSLKSHWPELVEVHWGRLRAPRVWIISGVTNIYDVRHVLDESRSDKARQCCLNAWFEARDFLIGASSIGDIRFLACNNNRGVVEDLRQKLIFKWDSIQGSGRQHRFTDQAVKLEITMEIGE